MCKFTSVCWTDSTTRDTHAANLKQQCTAIMTTSW